MAGSDHGKPREGANLAVETRSDADAERGSGFTAAAQGTASETAAAAEEVGWATRSYALESAIYHKAREGFLDLCHRWSLALILIGSNAAVLSLVKNPEIVGYLIAIPAVLASIDVAFGFAGKARDHRELAAEFLSVVSTLSSGPTPEQIREASARYHAACGREPATFVALQALAHNQACDALEDPEHPSLRHVVGLRFRILKNVFRFSTARFEFRQP